MRWPRALGIPEEVAVIENGIRLRSDADLARDRRLRAPR
jgi:hypothetical protein